jgi:CrcB protein
VEGLQRALLVGIGGFLGANARYWIGAWAGSRYGTGALPWATLAVNVSGAFLLGFLLALIAGRVSPASEITLRLLLASGFLGAYTTFSTFEHETLDLFRAGRLFPALANALGSLLAGFLAVWLGEITARRL